MIAEVTCKLKVKGSSKAIVAPGPNPGRIPTTVPRIVPIRAKRRFWREREMLKPMRIFSNMRVLLFSFPFTWALRRVIKVLPVIEPKET
jgi:hypothetical protein